LPLATLRRKAAFSWGWDFGPRLPSIGPWRPVELIHESGAVLSGHHVRTERVDVANQTADLTVRVEATQFQQRLVRDRRNSHLPKFCQLDGPERNN
jgi:beta-mannosidase